MNEARYSEKNVVANLGGMPVSIPPYFAEFVEYDGDPGFGEKRIEKKPVRTPQSKLKSFGFYMRYPDMAGLSSPELKKNKASYTIYNTMWIRVGINSGEFYPRDGFLDRLTHGYIEADNSNDPSHNYTKIPEIKYGLSIYQVLGVDPQTKKVYRDSMFSSDDIFIHRNDTGLVDAFIKCTNNVPGVATCKHLFGLEPLIKAKVYMSYRRDLLPEWQQIQLAVTQRIMSFKIETQTQTKP